MLRENPTQRISVCEALNHPWLNVLQHVLAETKAQPTPSVALQNVLTERWSPSPSDTLFTPSLPDVVASPVPTMASSSSTLRASPKRALRSKLRRSFQSTSSGLKGHAKRCTLHYGKRSNPLKAVACLQCRKTKARVRKPKLLTRGQFLSAKKKLRMKLRKAEDDGGKQSIS
ncbi:hypothetical protein CPC08DRAFT_823847 [Agrocybe pediades]|nr:hypothetical protein CPC08DRAFT_823847 [Agrocybe pediades]